MYGIKRLATIGLLGTAAVLSAPAQADQSQPQIRFACFAQVTDADEHHFSRREASDSDTFDSPEIVEHRGHIGGNAPDKQDAKRKAINACNGAHPPLAYSYRPRCGVLDSATYPARVTCDRLRQTKNNGKED